MRKTIEKILTKYLNQVHSTAFPLGSLQIVSEQYVLVPPSASVSGGAGKAGAHRANTMKVGVMPRELIVAENALESVKVCARLSWLCGRNPIGSIELLRVYVMLMCCLCLFIQHFGSNLKAQLAAVRVS